LLAPEGEFIRPTGHATQLTFGVVLYWPMGHAVHVVAPVLTTPVPAPTSAMEPALHGRHPLPGLDSNSPGVWQLEMFAPSCCKGAAGFAASLPVDPRPTTITTATADAVMSASATRRRRYGGGASASSSGKAGGPSAAAAPPLSFRLLSSSGCIMSGCIIMSPG
jgi:hypothetical protein